jgi:hypothetical protein
MPLPPLPELRDSLLAGDQLDLAGLAELIANHPRENLFLEYKDGCVLHQNPKHANALLRRGVSAFANSDGGIFILGVSELTDDEPRRMSPGKPPGSATLEEWAQNVLQPMAPFFSPQPRPHTVQHADGRVLVVAVARAPQYVPCIESGIQKYFLRAGDQSIEAPPYLMSDLILGRRSHPVVDLHVREANAKLIHTDNDSIVSTLSLGFHFRIESQSLAFASEVQVGLVSWSLQAPSVGLPSQLLGYVDASPVPAFLSADCWHLVHIPYVLPGQRSHPLRPFDVLHYDALGGLLVPAPRPLVTLSCAVYALPQGSPPTWFQLRYRYDSDDFRRLPEERRDRVLLERLGPARPLVTWQLGFEPTAPKL